MKGNSIKENPQSPSGNTQPITMKMNKNYLEPYNNFIIDELNIPENLSDKEIDSLKEKNKCFFFEFSKLAETNNLLKFKLQELILKKNEFHKYLIKLEHNGKNNINNRENICGNNSISHNIVNFQNNLYINRKRKRRKKSQIIYKYKCNFKDCNKKYATEGALNQHIKFKHM